MNKILILTCLCLLLSCSDNNSLINTYRTPKESAIREEKLPFSWVKPLSWISESPGELKKAQFRANSAEAFLVYMEGNRGNLLQNINRWRSQVGLAPISEKEISLANITTPLTKMQVYSCKNSSSDIESIIAFWSDEKGKWFFKMNGKIEVVENEKENFFAFLKSMKPL